MVTSETPSRQGAQRAVGASWGPLAPPCPAGSSCPMGPGPRGRLPQMHIRPPRSAALGLITSKSPSPGKCPKWEPCLQRDRISLCWDCRHASFRWFSRSTAVWAWAGVRRAGRASSLTVLWPAGGQPVAHGRVRQQPRGRWVLAPGPAPLGLHLLGHSRRQKEGAPTGRAPPGLCVRLSWRCTCSRSAGRLPECLHPDSRHPGGGDALGQTRVGGLQPMAGPTHHCGPLDLLSLAL